MRLGGLEGSHDGWLAVLCAAAAHRHRQGRATAVVAADGHRLIWVVAALYFVVRDGPPPGSHVGWGWFVALVGTLGMVTAAIGSIVGAAARRAGIAVGPSAASRGGEALAAAS